MVLPQDTLHNQHSLISCCPKYFQAKSTAVATQLFFFSLLSLRKYCSTWKHTFFYKYKYIYTCKYPFQSFQYKLLFLLVKPFLTCIAHEQPKNKHEFPVKRRERGKEEQNLILQEMLLKRTLNNSCAPITKYCLQQVKKSFAQRNSAKTKLSKESQGVEKSRKGGKFPWEESLGLSAWLRPTWLYSLV